ncbi:acyl carrier protein [Candidatus Curtissbacteria bacterium]|nr:acyl carrier protein [Candidatus Curtissbacteria bacterium]
MLVDYFEDLKKIIAGLYSVDEETIEEESLLDADLNISELDLEDLIAVLEEKYAIAIPQSVYSKFIKVGDIASFLYENADAA